MDKTPFNKCLRDALYAADVRMTDVAKEAGVDIHVTSNAVNGRTRPRKKAAHALTTVVLNEINKRLHESTDEMRALRGVGNALRQAYMDEYETQHKD